MTKYGASGIIEKPSSRLRAEGPFQAWGRHRRPNGQDGQRGPSFSLRLNDRPGGARAAQALLHMAVSSFPRDFGREEVMRMWKRKLLKAVLTVIFAVLTVVLLTTKAC